MKVFRLAAIVGAFGAALSGCTYADNFREPAHTSTPPAVVSTTPPADVASVRQGDFRSQDVATSGTATLRVTDAGAVLELKDVSTGQGEDLRIMLSPGTLSPNTEGELGLTSSTLIDLGPLKLTQAGQRVEVDSKMWADTPPVGSVVIYNYSNRVAFGTANLTEVNG